MTALRGPWQSWREPISQTKRQPERTTAFDDLEIRYSYDNFAIAHGRVCRGIVMYCG